MTPRDLFARQKTRNFYVGTQLLVLTQTFVLKHVRLVGADVFVSSVFIRKIRRLPKVSFDPPRAGYRGLRRVPTVGMVHYTEGCVQLATK